ncbi:preprotein translocase subunit SecG [Providencia rettgeri]|uniref:preprotein translocase subunit SecG n=1 Tax=Providencia rettgeri TaxID=587 RepID=UPI001EE6A255|nr:preprotein translocase subunit SecG [Providencia rettgeri]ELR5153066.1 preprotein translocase subunit SecG [Providencia rettgeri]MCG5278781.1 preprotein translocase subunit SecG [Providencia rettgeri]
MKTLFNILMFIVFIFLLTVILLCGVVLLQEPKCATAPLQERIEMRCQKALYDTRGR